MYLLVVWSGVACTDGDEDEEGESGETHLVHRLHWRLSHTKHTLSIYNKIVIITFDKISSVTYNTLILANVALD